MSLLNRVFARVSVTAAIALTLAGAGCGGHSSHPSPHPDGGAAGHGGSDGGVTPRKDAGPDQAPSTCSASVRSIDVGSSCSCDAECLSGHCVEGVCCSTACSGGCETCSAPDSPGTCVMRPAGAAPRTGATCPVDSPATCGLDGFCDGAGGCRKYLGNTCMHGTCMGDAVVGAFACDGTGQCKPGVTLMFCLPYTCNPSTGGCYNQCDSAAMCQSGGVCDFSNESCGKAQNGQPCTKDSGCISNHCADGVCCNAACTGACAACNLPGRVGTCFPVADGKADPRGICVDQGAASCGHDGTCDGVGGCANYAHDTTCLLPSCTGNRLNTAGTCDGLGTCRQPGVQNCHPFRCDKGACTTTCKTNDDCDTGAVCQNGTCGPKPPGFLCSAGSECASGYCVDGVCCDSACTGTCMFCALAASPGHCQMVAADNVDPRGVCTDNGPSACSTNGKCDGTGGCERYPTGTVCAAEKCDSGVFTAQSTCNATGQCVAPDSLPCAPYVCNGSECFRTCTTSDQCKAPNSCDTIKNSCGLKGNGAACSSGSECLSTFCAQGYCCNSACDGKCQSCALTNSPGACTNVPAGTVDPTGTCLDKGTASCGTNAKCDGNGGCQLYAQGTSCAGSTCPAGTTTFTAGSTCDGAGKCVTPNPNTCFPYQCGTNVCKNACTTDGDCAAPAVCIGGSCGLKGIGQTCGSGVECLSGFCAQGTCCGSACQGPCQSCALPSALGACTNVPNGSTDPQGTCHDQGNTSCLTDGFCDGNGACRLYAGGTSCAPPSCPATSTTLTSGRTCDGKGTCQPATTLACAPYVCNGATACKAACASDADCQSPSICDPMTSLCGNKKRLGQACAGNSDCLTGNSCVDGVCCSTAACPTCQSCNVTGSAGNCANVAANTAEPHNLCAASPPCGNTSLCDGAGHCQQGGTGVACGTATCTGSTFTPVSHCTGTGTCATPTSSACPNNFVCGTNACKTSCTADTDCVAPFTCQGSGTTKNCALKPNGQACTAAGQCISGNCVDGVCCGSSACGTCQACNLNGLGSCSPFAAGAVAPTGQCPVTTTCGNTGTCNGAGACTQAAATVVCGAATCTGVTYTPAPTCNGTGACGSPSSTTCGQYVCGTGACKTTCSADTDCATGNYCTGTGGSCVALKANGATCAATHECSSGNCVDGVCCMTSSCGTCQACNLNSLGTCSAVAAGGADPHARCAANGTCGNTGTCNGSGACTQAAASVVCGTASCTGTTYTPAATCTGSGACGTPTPSGCGRYVCGTGACKTTCSADTDCATGNYCTGTGGSCVALKANGATCTTTHECGSGNCVDGVCCMTSSCGTCQACNLNGAGTCSTVAAGGADPHARCAPNGTCGNTGTCNGSGACTQASISVMCVAPSCTAGIATAATFCNGTGSCPTAATAPCAPFVCGTTMCNGSCNVDGDCVSGDYCTGTGGMCLPKKALGATCASAHECGGAGNCVDGVCCMTSSCGTCQACNLNGAGTCSTVGNGATEPHARCAPDPLNSCGNTGTCTAGACTLAASGAGCGSVVCNASSTSYTPAGTCDGAGTCNTPGASDCTPFLCKATGCPHTCNSDADCITGDYCTGLGGTCMPRQTGDAACITNDQCASGICSTTEGVCCNAADCGPCASCKVPGSEGLCTPIPAGHPDTTGTCTKNALDLCGVDGNCNGTGGCELAPTSTVCAGPSCATGAHQVTQTSCDGMGGCTLTQLVTECSPLMCNGAASCLLSCSADTDCAVGTCQSGSCL